MEDSNSLMQQRKIEILLEMQAKKFDTELSSLKQYILSLNNELSSLKGQVSRMQFQQPAQNVQQSNRPEMQIQEQQHQSQEVPKKKVEIVDCRPENQRREEFVGGSAKNTAEPIRPRYGDYKSEDVSIEKFFYFGNKR